MNEGGEKMKYYVYISKDIFNQKDILSKIKRILVNMNENIAKKYILTINQEHENQYIVNVKSLQSESSLYCFKGILHI